MRVLGIIPARGGSKGVPGKNKKMLGTKPLIAHTIEAAKKSTLLTDIVISTDDSEIQAIGQEYGVEVPFLRPAHLASDTAKSIDVVRHALDFLKDKERVYDAVCLLQPTVPFREAQSIDEAISTYVQQELDSLISVLPVPHEYNPHWVFVPKDDTLAISTGDEEIIGRRQELPQAYHRDGSIYITATSLIEQHTFFGKRLGYVVSKLENHVNIDTLDDWQKAENILKTRYH